MKSANCISQTGRSPSTAAPTAAPMIAFSASGVSRHAIGAELLDEPIGDLERAAERADVLAEAEDRLVAAHLLRAAPSEIASR